jgi:hypothetical protein
LINKLFFVITRGRWTEFHAMTEDFSSQ